MNSITETTPEPGENLRATAVATRPGRGRRIAYLVSTGTVALAALGAGLVWNGRNAAPAQAMPPPPRVTVSRPLQRTVQGTARFLGQFSAVDQADLRAQVGGTLTAIDFRDGQIVHKGDLLFVIDPRPFQIRLEAAVAQLKTAEARETLDQAELWRAQQLRQASFGTAETVDQRTADLNGAHASVATAQASIKDAALDLEFAHVTAPFTGRIGAHQVSTGNLVSGSRGGTGPTTLLATIVALDPIHLDFDMSESDYRGWQAANHGATPKADVAISLDGEGHYDLHGTLDFIDNVVDRSSGTIHARVTVANPDLAITPGQFARLRVNIGKPTAALLVPAAAIVPDQSQQIAMTVAADGHVVPKPVRVGELDHGLRVIEGGLAPDDRVIINGLMYARPGMKVTPVPGVITPPAADDAIQG